MSTVDGPKQQTWHFKRLSRRDLVAGAAFALLFASFALAEDTGSAGVWQAPKSTEAGWTVEGDPYYGIYETNRRVWIGLEYPEAVLVTLP
jgi:hypothetical protein